MSFYCQFYSYIPTSSTFTVPTFKTCRQKWKLLSMFKFFLLLYIYINLHTVHAVYTNNLPIASLGVLPICLVTGLVFRSLPYPITFSSSLPNLPQTISTDNDKLAYISAWTSLHEHNKLCFMNFSPGDTPYAWIQEPPAVSATTAAALLPFIPSNNSVLSGIASGLHIEGKGTICWNILNDDGDTIELHIHDSLYVPSLPMNLLSPQNICQQTKNPDDGFIIGISTGLLCFANHQRTIYYHPKNNLPFFTSSTPSAGSSSSTLHSNSDTSTQALLSSIDTTCSPLTSTQQHLLLKHQQLGYLHMARVRQLARDGVLGPSKP